MGTETLRRLVVTADDFGISRSVNEAVIHAHQEGILSAASLMVNGEAAVEAVEMARDNPGLGVGLHLTLVHGRACLGQGELDGMVDRQGRLSDQPVWSGLRYFFEPRWWVPLQREIEAQFLRFRSTGLKLDHVNGHLHFHMHPIVLRILLQHREEWGIRGMRLTRDPWYLNVRWSSGRNDYRLMHYWVFRLLAGWVEPRLRRAGVRHTDRVFGLLQHGRVDGDFVQRLIEELPYGDSELYAHPSFDEGKGEYEALRAPRMRALLERHRIRLICYRDL